MSLWIVSMQRKLSPIKKSSTMEMETAIFEEILEHSHYSMRPHQGQQCMICIFIFVLIVKNILFQNKNDLRQIHDI
jgi:hypothetical protein